MKNVIFTSSDSKYGDFLVNHWLRSLKENVDLANTDVIVLDYGLTTAQVGDLTKQGVIVKTYPRKGHVTCIRWNAMEEILQDSAYDVVLSVDGGDIIFQDDISHLFFECKNDFGVVCEDFNLRFEKFFTDNHFREDDAVRIKESLNGKRMINAGVIFGPRDKFLQLCRELNFILEDKNSFGPEQVALNYILYKNRFMELDRNYNFVVNSMEHGVHVKQGVFYEKNGKLISVVHNAGMTTFFRPIENFGYGKSANRLKPFIYHFGRAFLKVYYSFTSPR